MRLSRWILATAACASLIGMTSAYASNKPLPNGLVLPKDVGVPNDTVLAVYIPANDLKLRSYSSMAGIWVDPGKALATARQEVGARYFSKVLPVDLNSSDTYGLLLAIDAKWNVDKGDLKLDLNYRVFAADGTQVLEGKETQTTGFNSGGIAGGFLNDALHGMQLVMIDVLKGLLPNAAKFPATAQLSAINKESLANKTEPVRTGTAFYINKSGQMMTAAHVLRDCLIIEGEKDGKKFSVSEHASSDLLDLAIGDSGNNTDKALPLRIGEELMLGEAVTNVGYPLQGLLASSPNLTRGNVSARAGLNGSVGLFQFSAPIQPGSSGGPVVSDGGELLGVTVSTLNAAALIREGLLPQNVNFALEARYAAMFMRKSHIDFIEVPANTKGDMKTANDAALASVIQLSCYQ